MEHRLENHYMNYSHAYHASETLRPGLGRDSFSPMKSKTLFRIHRSLLSKIRGRKVGFDLIYKLNPLVSVIPYENEKYNTEYRERKENLLVAHDPVFSNATVVPEVNLEKWQRACAEQRSHPPRRVAGATAPVSNPASDHDMVLRYLRTCCDRLPELFGGIKYALFHHANLRKDRYLDINTLKNKLGIIVYHLDLMKIGR